MGKQARRMKNTTVVRFCAPALAALLLAAPAAIPGVSGRGARGPAQRDKVSAGAGVVLSAGVVFADRSRTSGGRGSGDLVTRGDYAALADGYC